MTAKKLSRTAQLAKDLLQSKAHDIGTLASANRDIGKANTDKYMASGVIITVQNLSGANIVEPFMIVDGLSAETIAAIRADIKRTYDLRLALNKI
jgi:hypothetical protein